MGLQSLHRCPLLAYEWTLDLVPGGVQLRARLPVGRAKILLEALHCHTAIGKRFDSRRDLCVLQDPAVQVSTTRNGQDVTLQLTSTGSSGVEELRERVSALVGRPAGR